MTNQTTSEKDIHISDVGNSHLLSAHRLVREQINELNSYIDEPRIEEEVSTNPKISIAEIHNQLDTLYRWEAILKREITHRGFAKLPLRKVTKRNQVKSIKDIGCERVIEFEGEDYE